MGCVHSSSQSPKSVATTVFDFHEENNNHKQFLSLSTSSSNRSVSNSYKFDVDSILKAFKSNIILNNLINEKNITDDELITLITSMLSLDVKSNQLLCKLGDECDKLFYIDKGELLRIDETNEIKYRKGMICGEEGFIDGEKRSYILKTTKKSRIYILNRESLLFISKDLKMKSELKAVPLLSPLTSNELNKLVNHSTKVSFKAGDEIIKKDDPPSDFYIIIKGYVNVIGPDESPKNINKELTPKFLTPRSLSTPKSTTRFSFGIISKDCYFGEDSLVNNVPQTTTYTAVDDVELFKISQIGFDECLGPVRKKLAGRLDRKSKKIEAVKIQKSEKLSNMKSPKSSQGIASAFSTSAEDTPEEEEFTMVNLHCGMVDQSIFEWWV